ncbi:MAG: DUF2971 domain-containing protein [Aphanothece sp. CMT-3BRIN-NPC111]|jgi:hypothetical protein|nr:DUF2971 domain-containing protein [Aphanothece sp. CMT-3BRIN-NPC111]
MSYQDDYPEFCQFSGEEKIWRYMDLAKFISILQSRELYFNRGDCFEDKAEGSYSKLTLENLDTNINASFALGGIQLLDKEVREIVSLINQVNRLSVFVHCWHMNMHESYAMWDLYGKDDKGIAIQSTIDRLYNSLDNNINDKAVNIIKGKVHYLDFSQEEFKVLPIEISGLLSKVNCSISINAIFAFLHKRVSFEHEKEMRLIIDQSCDFDLLLPKETLIQIPGQPDDSNLQEALMQWRQNLKENLKRLKESSTGIKVKIKPNCLDHLIESVYISPKAPKWYESLVKGITTKYDLQCEVRKSDLNYDPLL